MPRFLITGFEPFTTGQGLVLTHNPTGNWAKEIALGLPSASHATLPVSYAQTKTALRQRFASDAPTIWLGLGFAPHRTRIDVEYIALNVEHAESGDNDGVCPRFRPIVEGGPTALTTRISVDGLVDRLNGAGLSAQSAFHAGTFLCNQSFYLGCYEVEVNKTLSLAAFIHVPPDIEEKIFVKTVIEWLKTLSQGDSV